MMSCCPGRCHYSPGTLDPTGVVKNTHEPIQSTAWNTYVPPQQGHHKTGDSRTALQNTGRPNYLVSIRGPVWARHRTHRAGVWLSPGARQRWEVCIDSVLGPRVGIRKPSQSCGHPRVQNVEASVSLIINWKEALYFVCLQVAERGKQAVIISQV